MPWSLLPTLRTNQMEILHFHFIFPLTWYPFIQHQQSSNQVQVNWTPKGHVFPTGAWPSWAVENMWAPEIHFVNGTFVVYFTGWYNLRSDQLLCVITGGSVLLWTVHRVHVGVAVSTSGSPWGPYTDPRGTFALSFEWSLMIVFPEKIHPQVSLWWRSPSAWQVQSTHTISGAGRSFVDKDIIDDVDICVVVIDIRIFFNGWHWYSCWYQSIDLSQLTTQRPIIWASLPPMADGQHVVKRPRGSCHRIHQVAKIVAVFICPHFPKT